jgi:regulator of cell morphogenesis and NO signaling
MQTSVEPGRGTADGRDTRHLIRRIGRYHASHRRDLPRLCALARKVEECHADDPRAPLGLADHLEAIRRELEEHMRREERTLFPSMLRNAARLDTPLAEMRGQHSGHAAHLRRIARLTHGFTPPEGACPEWWALYAMAFSFADDLEEHMHLENDVLFPRYERAEALG